MSDIFRVLFPAGRTVQWATLTLLTAGVFLGGALYMEHIMGLAPCPLCMMQRVWMLLVGLLALVGLAHRPNWGIYPLLGVAAAGVGGGFSIRQLYLQSLPPELHPACGPDLGYMLDAFPLADVLIAMTSGTGDCAQVSWSLFGISIPGYALLGFVVLVALNIAHLRACGSRG